MFANKIAIETLVESDSRATPDEKRVVLLAIAGGIGSDAAKSSSQVMSIQDAAQFLGKPRKAIYNLLRNGTLKGFYSGKKHNRATGITRASLDAAVSQVRRYS